MRRVEDEAYIKVERDEWSSHVELHTHLPGTHFSFALDSQVV